MLSVSRSLARLTATSCSSRQCPSTLLAAVDARYLSDAADGPKKKQKKAKTKATIKDKGGGRSRELDIILSALDAPKRVEPPIDEEEAARREAVRKAYTVGMFRRHNAENHDLACKIRMKNHAIKLLPKNDIKEKALKVEVNEATDAPLRWRKVPKWTPPIPGFDPAKFAEAEDM